MKTLLFIIIITIAGVSCNGSTAPEATTNDTMPVIKPEITDTNMNDTPPPTGDSNVIHPDSAVENR